MDYDDSFEGLKLLSRYSWNNGWENMYTSSDWFEVFASIKL